MESIRKILEEVGAYINDKFIEKRIGTGTRKTLEDALKASNSTFDDEKLEKLVRKKLRLQTELFEIVDLFEGTTELLDGLYGRTKIALATMSNSKVVDRLLLEKRIEKYFDVVVTADEVHKPKPDPEIFLLSATKLHVNPEQCIVVEDSIFGVKAAKAAGMKCIAIPSGAYTKEELENENPHLLVSSITEKEKILDFIFKENVYTAK